MGEILPEIVLRNVKLNADITAKSWNFWEESAIWDSHDILNITKLPIGYTVNWKYSRKQVKILIERLDELR